MAQDSIQIANLALQKLGAVADGQSPTPGHGATALSGVVRSHAELAHHSIAYWGLDECPDAVAEAFADYVAGSIAIMIVGEDRAPAFRAGMGGAMRRMAAVTAQRDASDAPVKITDY